MNEKKEFFPEEKTEKWTETATDVYLESLDPELWQKNSSWSPKERDDRWFSLTQKHLKDWKVGKQKTEGFKKEELEFLFLNHFFAERSPLLNSELPQRGFYFSPETGKEKFVNFGRFIEKIQQEAESHLEKTSKPFWTLVGGIGISGKATLRNILTKELTEKLSQRKIISWDRDYQKTFPPPWEGDINIIEDVHGLDKDLERFDGKEGLPEGYNLVLYCLSPKPTYRQTLLGRGKGWVEIGKIDLTASEKEASAQIEERIKETAAELERTLKVAKSWFREHLTVLRGLKNRGVKIAVVDPTRIFQELYHFEEKPELLEESFLESLERVFKEK